MKTPTRIYLVSDNEEGTHRLVRTTSPNAAISHVSRTRFTSAVATQDDLEKLLTDGVKVENPHQGEPAQA